MRFDLDSVAVACDRAGGAHVDALGAALLRGAAVRADAFLVDEEFRLLELADQLGQLLRRQRLLERIGARREVTLRKVRRLQHRLARQIENKIEFFAAGGVGSTEVDRANRPAGLYTCAMTCASVEVDLIGKVDCFFRARTHARVTADAHFEVDRVVLCPVHCERAEIAGDPADPSRPHLIAARNRQLSAPA